MASTYLSETTLGTATNATKFTFSAWVKTSFVGAGGSNDYQLLLGSKPDHTSGREGVWIWQNSELAFYNYPSAGGSAIVTRTSAKLRDVNGWYHIVVTGDASQSGTDKLKFYINGELQTAFDEDNRSNFATIAHGIQDTSSEVTIGGYSGADYYLDGYMSHVHFTDGYAYAASTFGSTDATTGEWKINTSPSVTYGNNGFFILKDGNSVTDQSGNSNNFTVAGGNLTNSEDCPSDVFNTWNRNLGNNLIPGFTFSNANNTVDFATPANDSWGFSNLGAFSGKYYAEFKVSNFSNNSHYVGVKFFDGIMSTDNFKNTIFLRFAKSGNTNQIYSGFTSGFIQSNLDSFSDGDIIGIAVDIDNGTVNFTRNGAQYATQVTGQASNFAGKQLQFAIFGEGHGSQSGRTFKIKANFGNGYFATTAISSEGTNASNIGKFEYDVPSGFTAFSTKGINS